MAKFELKFIDICCKEDFIKCEIGAYVNENDITVDGIHINGKESGENFLIVLDKSTAIKFAKTLRTEINKITESEVNHE